MVNNCLHVPTALSPGERVPGIGGLVGLRAGLDTMGKRKTLPLPGTKLQPVAMLIQVSQLKHMPLTISIKQAKYIRFINFHLSYVCQISTF
jgi:hypothetical protein